MGLQLPSHLVKPSIICGSQFSSCWLNIDFFSKSRQIVTYHYNMVIFYLKSSKYIRYHYVVHIWRKVRWYCIHSLGPILMYTVLLPVWRLIPIIKIRQSHNCLIFMAERQSLYRDRASLISVLPLLLVSYTLHFVILDCVIIRPVRNDYTEYYQYMKVFFHQRTPQNAS